VQLAPDEATVAEEAAAAVAGLPGEARTGFTRKSAQTFFTQLRDAGVKRLVDVRLNNTSQLAGFTRKDHLRYFTHAICGIDYVHLPALAPTADILDAFNKHQGDWSRYDQRFLDLLRSRRIEETVSPGMLEGGCLLCAEEKPRHCHRRLVAEYLRDKWGNVEIEHLP
jgi:uncharacterized protein YeaO (DUF488 family)